jgi:hypothetical protein
MSRSRSPIHLVSVVRADCGMRSHDTSVHGIPVMAQQNLTSVAPGLRLQITSIYRQITDFERLQERVNGESHSLAVLLNLTQMGVHTGLVVPVESVQPLATR